MKPADVPPYLGFKEGWRPADILIQSTFYPPNCEKSGQTIPTWRGTETGRKALFIGLVRMWKKWVRGVGQRRMNYMRVNIHMFSDGRSCYLWLNLKDCLVNRIDNLRENFYIWCLILFRKSELYFLKFWSNYLKIASEIIISSRLCFRQSRMPFFSISRIKNSIIYLWMRNWWKSMNLSNVSYNL